MRNWFRRWWLDMQEGLRILLSVEFWKYFVEYWGNRIKQISDNPKPLPISVNLLLPTFYPGRVKFQVEFNRLARCMPMTYEDFTDQVFRQLSTGEDPMTALENIMTGETL